MRRVGSAAVVLLLPAVAIAAAERTWTPLVRGTVPASQVIDGAAPTSRGTIAVAPEKKELAGPPSPYLWSLAVGREGIYAGSGDSGEIWRIPEDGKAAVSVLKPEKELQAAALAVSEGKVYAGLTPGARLVALKAAGADTVWKTPSEPYIWSILPDRKGKALHVAVGSPGRVYRVEPGAASPARVELESGDAAVRCLAWSKDGKLLAGTDGRGLVIRVDGDGSRFVLFGAPRREISSLSVAPDGTIWFAAVGQLEPATPAGAPTPSPAPTPGEPKSGPPALLFKMRPDGFAEGVWTAPGASIFSVVADDAGATVTTGDPAAVWRIEPDGASRKILDPLAGQATALIPAGADLLLATANPSKVFRLKASRGTAASFEASPLDTAGFSHWGKLTWVATNASGARVEVSTRSGNATPPDGSWSAWSAPLASGSEVPSPSARYLQWRVKLSGSSQVELSELSVIFRVENRAPRVDWVFVEEPGVTLAPKADAPPSYTLPPEEKPRVVRRELPQKRGYQKGWRAARWAALDPDGDDLTYTVAIHAVGDPLWTTLASNIPESYTTWDETNFPDGRYEVQVTASDLAVNGKGAGLEGIRVSQPFEVDNTPPRVEDLSARAGKAGLELSFTATDAGTGVAGASVQVDAGSFVSLVPEDGIADSARERYSVTLPSPGAGEHRVTVRVEDRAGNTAVARTVVR